ncbi:MAG: serine hydrolase domain-containing protein [Planctomycetota bacterium]|jgi:CubicO group peptidase (beta-lactamase class C family)
MWRVAMLWLLWPATAVLAQAEEERPPLKATLDTYLQRCASFGWSGSALVAGDGEILLQGGYGLADRERGTPNTEHTLFEIASATKPFTAAAILKLEEQGKLSTDDPIGKYLPGVPEECGDIKIYHLLTHTSGMPRSAAGGGGHDLERAVAGYCRSRPVRKPGEKYEYWNGGYALLAGIVEVVTGGTYMDYCRKHLFEPAGMTRSGFTGDTHLDSEAMAVGYTDERPVRQAVGHPYRSYGWQYRGMGGIVTSVVDLYRWDRALHGDTVLAAATRKKAFEPFLSGYACGWRVLETTRKTRKVMHGGSVRGFHTGFVRFPDDDAVIAVTCNLDGIPLFAIAGGLEGLLFGEKPKFPMPPAIVELADADRDTVTGTYVLSEDSQFVVRRAGKGILIGAVGQGAVDLLGARIRFEDRSDRFGKHTRVAVQVTEGVARGDVEMLRDVMLDWIPKSWPDTVKRIIWPRHLEKWGEFRSLRSIGASYVGRDRVQILLALEHAKGTAHCRVVLQGGKLNIFDLNGPEFALTAKCQPTSRERYVRFEWSGPPRPPVVFERDEQGRVTALVIELSGRVVRGRRIEGG